MNETALPDGGTIPRLGQGTWNIGDDAARRAEEIAALRLGIELGMTLIDTAEMYGGGRSEMLIGEAVAGMRDKVFLVSKVYPHNAGGERLRQSCEASLKRLQTDYLDLYLLHWRGSIALAETVAGMEALRAAGKIRRWGVSNLDTEDMQALWRLPDGDRCVTNQVLYHLGSRGVERDLQPWLRARGIPMMAYCPLAQGGRLREGLLAHPVMQEVAQAYGVRPLQILLAWVLRDGSTVAIPKAGTPQHVEENVRAAALRLDEESLRRLDMAFPAPQRRVPLDIV